MLKCVCVYLHLCVFQVAMSTMDNPLLKYNAKEYFFKASLCHFIVDELNAKVTHTASQTVTDTDACVIFQREILTFACCSSGRQGFLCFATSFCTLVRRP